MRRSVLVLAILLVGCGGRGGGGGAASPTFSVVSTDVHAEGGVTLHYYPGSVATSDTGSVPAPTHVEVEVTDGQSGFVVYCERSGGDYVRYDCAYAAGSTTAGTFSFDSATGVYTALKGTSGDFTLTPALDASGATSSTLLMSPKPIAAS